MERLSAALTEPVRRALADLVRKPFEPASEALLERVYRRPTGDPGLVHWQSPAVRVHSDLPAMMVGGIGALLFQTLHPGAMAGVADHSNYRKDPLGRLRRTAQFVAVTTYGNTLEAEHVLARIRKAHRVVVGLRPDGVPYAAEDPSLLRWVHVTEVATFLRASEVYGPYRLTPEECDQYFADVAPIAVRLGATELPRSRAEVEAYLQRVRSELHYGPQAREAVQVLLHGLFPKREEAAAVSFLALCARSVLPTWACERLELPPLEGLGRMVVEQGARAVFELVRWALPPHPLSLACRERQTGMALGARARSL